MAEARKCCEDPTCSKCLLQNCTDTNCLVHTVDLKDRRRNGNRWYIVPQTEEQRLENVKKIETMRAKGLLQKYEKTFQLDKDGDVTEIPPAI